MRWITKFADEQGSGINGESCAHANYKIKISTGIIPREWELTEYTSTNEYLHGGG
jgi:hypothetical protein